MLIKLSQIRIDGGTQVRAEINQQTVDEYADAFDSGVKFPPLTVYHDGATYWLADGFHRYHAARKAGLVGIQCDVKKGTVTEAQWEAIGANVAHGLRRTNADKRKAVEMALKMHPELSDEAIAEHAGVSHELVRQIKKPLVQAGKLCQPDHKIGKDGKRYPVPPPPPPTRPQTTATTPPPPTPPPNPPKPVNEQSEGPFDSLQRLIPKELQPMWERRGEIEALKARISDVRVTLRKARESGDPLFAGMPQEVLTWLDNTHSELDNCKPFVVCPWCGGLSGTCKMCRGPSRGFVSKFQWNTFATDEMKALVEKGGAR